MDISNFISNLLVILVFSNIITFGIGWCLPNEKIIIVAKKLSQLMRLKFGKKFEEKVESAVSAFSDGLKSDNDEVK